MPYPALINSAADDSGPARAGRRVFSPGAGDVRFALCGVRISSVYHVRMNKSIDAGLTWSEIDTSNEPTIEPRTYGLEFDAVIDPADANIIIVAWIAPGVTSVQPLWTEYGEHKITTFDMTTGLWGSASTGGPPVSSAPGSLFGSDISAQVYNGIFFNICKDPADGSVWLAYLILASDGLFTEAMLRPSIIQLDSGGVWGAPIPIMAEPAVFGNFFPCGICVGDSSRIHVTAMQYNMTRSPLNTVSDWLNVYHQSYLGGVLGSVQFIDSQLFAAGQFETCASPLVARAVGTTTEILFGYGWTPHATSPTSANIDFVEEKVARAISTADPVWAIETIPGVSNVANFDYFVMWCAPVTDGDRLVAYSNFSSDRFLGTTGGNVWLSEYTGGAWSTARYVFVPGVDFTIYGDVGYLNLVNGGRSVGVVLNAASTGPAYYYELSLQSAARNYIF